MKICAYFIPILHIIFVFQLRAQTIQVVVHQGANRHAPENTFSAARQAVEMGGDYLGIDVRQNKEGAFFAFHDDTLSRTTNGTGQFYDLPKADIEQLDAGNWFRHGFKGEKIPTVKDLVKEFKGKIKFYFNFRQGNIAEFIKLIQSLNVEKDCFLSLSHIKNKGIRPSAINFKANVSNIKELIEADKQWGPAIVEVSISDMSDKLISEAHQRGIKVMAHVLGDQYKVYLRAIRHDDVDMILLDNPDVFRFMEKTGKYPKPNWIAHRGGVVTDQIREYNPEGVKKAFQQGYNGVEIDIWETLDHRLVVHHDRSLKSFDDIDKNIDQLPLKELQDLRAKVGGYHILTLDEYLTLVPENAMLMLDMKTEVQNRDSLYYPNLIHILKKRHSLNHCLLLGGEGEEVRKYFWGQARFSISISEFPEIVEEWRRGENIASNYFLFDNGNEMYPKIIRLAQTMHLEIIPGINTFRYKRENFLFGGLRDINFLRSLGVRVFQIDSVYEINM